MNARSAPSEVRPATRTRQSALKGCLWRAAAIAFIVGFLAATAALAEHLDWDRELEKSLGRILFFGGAVSIAFVIFSRARQHEADDAAEAMEDDPRAPVLYLRPFAADAASSRLRGGKTEEEQLAAVLGGIGPVVAIGRPGEELPELGAARLYVSDREWKAAVRDLMDRAILVVMRLGDTDACWWELEQVTARVAPESLLLLVPAGGEGYDVLRARADPLLPHPLPDLPRRRRTLGTLEAFVEFDDDWTPGVLPFRTSFWRTRATRPLETALALTLRPVFERFAPAWRPPGPNPLRVLVFGALGVWLIGMAVLVLSGRFPE